MSSTANQVWDAISSHSATLAEQTGKAIVAVDAGHRVAASGVHWKPGVIVTASHLVRRADEVSVILPDGSKVKGTIAGRDGTTDLAAVQIEGTAILATLPPASGANVGELVLAVARSGRGELSASAGIVARVGGPWISWRGGQIDRLLRPDVRLYPGQSGSALVNGRGELLGVANPSAPAAVTGFILTSMHCAMFSQRQCSNSIADSFVIRPSAMSF
jgi:serine protease DegQ